MNSKINSFMLGTIPFCVSRWGYVGQAIALGMEFDLEDLPVLNRFEASLNDSLMSGVYYRIIVEMDNVQ
jgi:hypothetical protein